MRNSFLDNKLQSRNSVRLHFWIVENITKDGVAMANIFGVTK